MLTFLFNVVQILIFEIKNYVAISVRRFLFFSKLCLNLHFLQNIFLYSNSQKFRSYLNKFLSDKVGRKSI